MEPTFVDRMGTGPAFAILFLVYHLMSTVMGYGAALLLLPRDMKRDSLAYAPVFGYCVLVFGGWQLMFLGPPGSNHWWHWLLLAGGALTVAGCIIYRKRLRETFHGDVAWLALAAAVGVCFLASPITRQPHLTGFSILNSDIAHYTAVERMVQEHRGDMASGVEDQFGLGHAIRNTVTGAYLGTAVLGSALRVPLYQLQNVSLAVYQLWGAMLAGLFALRVLRFQRPGAVLVAMVSGVATLTLFTAWNVFKSQFAAMALLMALFCVLVPAFEAGPEERPWRRLPAVIALGLGLTLTYPHQVLLAWAVLGAVGTAHAVARRSLKRFGEVVVLTAGSMAAMAILSPARARAMVDYLFAMGKVEAGFYIPWMSPLTFLGLSSEGLMNEDPRSWWVMAPVLLGFAALIGWGLRRAWLQDRPAMVTAASVLGTVGLGYLVLCATGAQDGVPGGYKSYKLLSFHYPLVLGAALLAFRELAARAGAWRMRAAQASAVALAAGVVWTSAADVRAARYTRYVVTPELVDLQRLERDPRVESINIVTSEWWFRLWETAFLLKKPLYQKEGSYYPKAERLAGQWTLETIPEPDEVLVQEEPDPARRIEVNQGYVLVRSEDHLKLRYGVGWHDAEEHHRWTSAQRAVLQVDVDVPRRAVLELKYQHLAPGTAFDVLLGEQQRVGHCEAADSCTVGPLSFPAGFSTLVLASSRPPSSPGPSDPRPLGTAYYRIHLEPVVAN